MDVKGAVIDDLVTTQAHVPNEISSDALALLEWTHQGILDWTCNFEKNLSTGTIKDILLLLQ